MEKRKLSIPLSINKNSTKYTRTLELYTFLQFYRATVLFEKFEQNNYNTNPSSPVQFDPSITLSSFTFPLPKDIPPRSILRQLLGIYLPDFRRLFRSSHPSQGVYDLHIPSRIPPHHHVFFPYIRIDTPLAPCSHHVRDP